jgi:hypothetical protein
MWTSLERSIDFVKKSPFSDLKKGDKGYDEITFAADRGIVDDSEKSFRPNDPLTLGDALLWLFRTRNVEGKAKTLTLEDLPDLLQRYPIALLPPAGGASVILSEDQLLSLMRNLDSLLAQEVHEISLYAEDFQGAGTAFGEKFNMDALTAAHRTFPYNTLVRVTDIEGGKSVIVRVNDRGPYVKGRDMDLSLAAFLQLAPRSKGVLHATFQRLGDASIVEPCTEDQRYQSLIVKGVRLLPGVPHTFRLGGTLNLHGPTSFVVRSVTYPDGNVNPAQDWILPGENFRFVPSIPGIYTFLVGAVDGRERDMTMRVVDCSS